MVFSVAAGLAAIAAVASLLRGGRYVLAELGQALHDESVTRIP